MTYIIAEAGVNHNGQINLAHKLVDEASKAGVDAVKFQTFTARSLVTPNTPKVPYQLNSSSPNESHYEMIKSLELSYEDHIVLKKHCDEIGIDFLSTPYDVESAKFLHEKLNVKFFKTASADIVDLPLQEYIASTNIPSIVSVGMASIEEIETVNNIYKKFSNLKPTYLHCVSNYPCSNESLNLRVLTSLIKEFQCPIGYSDHSLGSTAAIMAIALGAVIIEKHFTLDKKLSGPDHAASSDINELTELVKDIRICNSQLGNTKKEVQKEELKMRQISRKSLHYSKSFRELHVIRKGDLCLRRPGYGIYYKDINNLIGKALKEKVEEGQIVELKDFK